MSETKTLCSHKVWRGRGFSGRCSRTAKVERNGMPYCKIHDPEEIKARNEAFEIKWRLEDDAKRIEREAKKRRAEAGEMGIELAKAIIGYEKSGVGRIPYFVSIYAKSIIDKLEGK